MISLAWTLLHFLWQGAALALLFAAANVILRNSTARVRYAAACTTMLLMIASAVATFALLNQDSPAISRKAPQFLSNSFISLIPDLPIRSLSSTPSYLLWLVYAWMIGVAVLSVR